MTARALLALLVLPALFASACSDPADSNTHDLGVTRAPDTSSPTAPARTELAEVEAAQASPARTEVQAAPRPAAPVDTVVTVVDPGGAPVEGVPVVGCDVDDEGRAKGRVRWTFAVETDARGEATVPARRVGPRFAAGLFGRAAALSTEDDPYRIVLPECGALEIDLTALTAKARVRIAPKEKRRKPERFDVAAGGTLLVERVLLGESFQVRVQSDAGRASLDVEGPRVAEQTVTVRPEFEPMVELRAALVDEKGEPLERMAVIVNQAGDDDGPVLSMPPSDPQGVVSKHYRRSSFLAEPEADVTFEEFAVQMGVAEVGRTGVAPLPAPSADGAYDFGEVVMRKPPIVVAGVVRDADGEPVAGASLSVETRDLDPYVELESIGLGGLDDLIYEGGTSRTNGRFEIRYPYPEEMRGKPGLVVSVGRPGVTGGLYVPFELGAEDVVIELEEPGTLFVDGSDLWQDVWDQLEIDVSPAYVEGEPTRIDEFQNMSEGALGDALPRTWAQRLVPGTYDVSVSLGWRTVASVEGVVVEPGEVSSDARLAPLVLDRVYTPKTVVVQRADGTPIVGAYAAYADPVVIEIRSEIERMRTTAEGKGEGREELERLEFYDRTWSDPIGDPSGKDGKVTLLTCDDPMHEVAVFAEGYLGQGATNTADGATIVLDPLVPVTVVFEDASVDQVGEYYYEELTLEPMSRDIVWDSVPWIEIEALPYEEEVLLPPGVTIRVDGEDSPWSDQRFAVPQGGGRIVLEAAEDES